MSTRSLTHIYEDDGKTILLTMYRHSDGYPEGHGADLAAFLDGIEIVNGLSLNPKRVANGMPCLAAQVVAHFKDGPGGIYIYKAGAKDCGEEYTYHVKPNTAGGLRLEVREALGRRKLLFSGLPGEVLHAIKKK